MNRLFEIFFLFSTMAILCMSATRAYGKLVNIVSIMVISWCGLCGLMALGCYGAFPISITTIFIVCLSCYAYALPCLLLRNRKPALAIEFAAPSEYNIQMVVIVNIVAILVCLYLSRTMWQILLTEGFVSARYHFLTASKTGKVYSTHQIYVLYVCFSVFTATILAAVHSVLSKKYNKVLIFLAVLDLVLYVMAIAGRMTIFRFLFYIGIGFLYKAGRLRLNKKEKFLVLATCVILIYITNMRRIVNSTSILQDIFYYFAGGFGYLNYIVENPSQFITKPARLYGRAIFGFIVQPIEMLLNLTGIAHFTISDLVFTNVAQEYYEVATGIRLNHLCTAAFYFYVDYGIFGIIIGFAVLALIASYIYRKSCTAIVNTAFWQCMLLYISYVIFFTIWDYQLLSWTIIVTVFFLYNFTAEKSSFRFSK